MTRALAIGWLLLCVLGAGWLLHMTGAAGSRIDTNLFALLPAGSYDPAAAAGTRALSEAGERQLIVLIGDPDATRALAGARLARRLLAAAPLVAVPGAEQADRTVDFYAGYGPDMVTEDSLKRLASGAGAEFYFRRSLAAAYGPVSAGVLPWSADPFSLYSDWLSERAAVTRVRPLAGEIAVQAEGRTYILLTYQLAGSAFSLELPQIVAAQVAATRAAVGAAFPGAQFLSAGVVLHAAAAASAAQRELRVIGVGSTLGALLLVILVFRSVRPAALVVLSLATGTLLAVCVSFLVFARVHVLTLVFGASLVGVAVDYGLLALGAALGDSDGPGERHRRLRPVLWLAILTTLVGYLALAATPFPGLLQMAVFSAAGITGAWLTVLLWFPWLEPASIAMTPLSRWIAGWLERWPRLGGRHWALLVCLTVIVAVGLARVRADDDVRGLVRTDPKLVADQLAVGRLLNFPSPAQFFVVEAADPESMLELTEQLCRRLDVLVSEGKLGGYDSASQWVPSLARQRQARQIVSAVLLAPAAGPIQRLGRATGLDVPDYEARVDAAPLLTPEAWLAHPVSAPFRALWLGRVPGGHGVSSLVLLRGLSDRGTGRELAALTLPGVRYIDKPAQITALMRVERRRLSALLAAGYVMAGFVLWLRYKRQAWRVILPTMAATLLTVALHGLIGAGIGMITLVALLLLLGMGVDYGIFLAERPDDGRMFLAIGLSAASTVLSFGLLAFSVTPALHAFGLATLLSMLSVWILAPLCRAPSARGGGR